MPDLWNNLGRKGGVGYLPRLLAIEVGKQRHTRNCVKTCRQQPKTFTKNLCPFVALLTGRKSPELAIRPYLGWKNILEKFLFILRTPQNHKPELLTFSFHFPSLFHIFRGFLSNFMSVDFQKNISIIRNTIRCGFSFLIIFISMSNRSDTFLSYTSPIFYRPARIGYLCRSFCIFYCLPLTDNKYEQKLTNIFFIVFCNFKISVNRLPLKI